MPLHPCPAQSSVYQASHCSALLIGCVKFCSRLYCEMIIRKPPKGTFFQSESNSRLENEWTSHKKVKFQSGVMHSRHLAGHVLPPHGNRVNVDRHCCTSKLSARSRTPLWRATSTTQEFYRILWNRNLDSIQIFDAWFKQLLCDSSDKQRHNLKFILMHGEIAQTWTNS